MFDGQIFKTVDPNDYRITPFKLYKEWSFTNSNYLSSSIQINHGLLLTSSFNLGLDVPLEPTNSDGTFKRCVYNLTNHLYYKNNELPLNYYGEYENAVTLSLSESCWFIGVPTMIYGEQIKPKSFQLEFDEYDVRDLSGKCNLVDINNNNKHIGNIFYNTGNIVLTDSSSIFKFNSSSFDSISFKGQVTLFEHEIILHITETEYQSTYNPTVFQGEYITRSIDEPIYTQIGTLEWSNITESLEDEYIYGIDSSQLHKSCSFTWDYTGKHILKNSLYSGSWGPYITTLGLYNDNLDLLVVAKLPNPLKNEPGKALTFIIRFDT